MLERLTDNLLLWAGSEAHWMRDLALQLQIDRLVVQSSGLDRGGRVVPIRSSETAQARQVVGWISLSVDPPQLRVENRSDAPIFDVLPTPLLWAQDQNGVDAAMVGGAPFWNSTVGQIDPGNAYVWPLVEATGWGRDPLVKSQLHLEFTDAAGRRWLHAHDHLSRKS